jgi:hypothetical protein
VLCESYDAPRPKTLTALSLKEDNTMQKTTFSLALILTVYLFTAANLAAQTTYCQGGANLRFVGLGSSAQFNALAFAAVSLESAAHSNSYAVISFKGNQITDTRVPVVDSAANNGVGATWVVYDPSAPSNAPCDAYVYILTEPAIANRCFFAYGKYIAASGPNSGKTFDSVGACALTLPSLPIKEGNDIAGLPDACVINGTPVTCDSNGVPSTIWVALNTSPQNQINSNTAPQPYCGNVSTVTVTAQYWCEFNAAGTDFRPEDAAYATVRALATPYNGIVPVMTHGGTLTQLGYGTSNSNGCIGRLNVGCGIYDSFQNGNAAPNPAIFNMVNFKISGTDPIAAGTIPQYTTLPVGALPLMVIAGNEDTNNLGQTFTDGAGNTNYVYTDINRQVLQQYFSGYSFCLGDVQSAAAGASLAGVPLQVILREPPSGAYNVFEFTVARTLTGSANPAQNASAPNSNDDNGQDQFNDTTWPGITGAVNCTYGAGDIPSSNCFNPLLLNNVSGGGSRCPGVAGGTAPGLPVRLRAVGAGEEVKAVIGSLNRGISGSTTVFNPLGYVFWGFQNLNSLCSAITGTSCTGAWLGHYLTVDGVDPLFATEGGEFDNGYGNPGNPVPRNLPFNPSGVNNPPICDFKIGTVCPTIPFTHLKDGKYPLWSMLRTVTFAPVTDKLITPTGVLDMIANEETAAASDGLSDYLPFWNAIAGSNGVYTGNLNLFVYRSHFKQSSVAAANGHKACNGTFVGVPLRGGVSGANTCLVDFGGDMGGSVVTVQSDVDFDYDFATEEYYLHQ